MRVLLYRCDWCGVEAAAVSERAPATWGMLAGQPHAGEPQADELCGECMAAAWRARVVAKRERAQGGGGSGAAASGREVVTFEDAWAKKIMKGYRYGPDALEQVRLGWEMRQPEIDDTLALLGRGVELFGGDDEKLKALREALRDIVDACVDHACHLKCIVCGAHHEAHGEGSTCPISNAMRLLGMEPW